MSTGLAIFLVACIFFAVTSEGFRRFLGWSLAAIAGLVVLALALNSADEADRPHALFLPLGLREPRLYLLRQAAAGRKRLPVAALIATVAAAAIAPSPCTAANITSGVDQSGNHYLMLEGPIAPGDPEKLAAAILEANARGYRLDTLRLNSLGGTVWEAMAMAVMVRWVERLSTAVQKDAKCESSCFALFAAAYQNYVDPSSDPTQIGVHSIYTAQQQGGMSVFVRENESTTVWAVRRLKAIGVPDSVIGKIVTTPPDRMTYLAIADLQEMGVELPGYPRPPTEPSHWPATDSIWLSPAMAKSDIRLEDGTVIPSGTVVVSVDREEPGASLFADHCFLHLVPVSGYMCNVTYHLPNRQPSTARLAESSLTQIRQGFEASPSRPRSQPGIPAPTRWLTCVPPIDPAESNPDIGIDVAINDDANGDATFFSAVHRMKNGETYDRSQQYFDIRKISGSAWEGKRKKRPADVMTGMLRHSDSGWFYQEIINNNSTKSPCDGSQQVIVGGNLFAAAAPAPRANTETAEPIMLECDVQGRVVWPSWHDVIQIDQTWAVNDYTFEQVDGTGTVRTVISRSSGVITQTYTKKGDPLSGMYRIGQCKKVSPGERKF
jgi:hypothetical protein